MKTKYALLAVLLMTVADMITLPAAAANSEPLQAIFSEKGDRISIFTAFPIQEGAELLIANETIPSDEVSSQVDIRTTFLIDNSGSVPKKSRTELLDAVRQYAEAMPDNEQVRIAKFDTETTVLSDSYSNDAKYLEYQLEQINFSGQETYVYDALLAVTANAGLSEDVYSRTVLITDGIDTVGGTSFDLLRSEIMEKGRYHIDVMQVGDGKQPDVNLKAIGSLGSNTFSTFENKGSLMALRPGAVYKVSAPLTNSVTTGEMKGITIKNGADNISLGSFLIPQAEIAEPETTPPATTSATTTSATTTTAAPPEPEEEGGIPLAVWIVLGVLALAGASVGAFLLLTEKVCTMEVRVSKQSPTDGSGTGIQKFRFPAGKDGRFRVGRVTNPKDDNGQALPANDFAVCEQDAVNSIGRNAFELFCEKKTVKIQNTAKSAVFEIEPAGGPAGVLMPTRSQEIKEGDAILLGNYTTLKIDSIKFGRERRRGKRGK